MSPAWASLHVQFSTTAKSERLSSNVARTHEDDCSNGNPVKENTAVQSRASDHAKVSTSHPQDSLPLPGG